MARRSIEVSLATKLRLLLGAAVLGIIAAALLVPWYFMELLAEQGVQRPAALLTGLWFNEWLNEHPTDPNAESDVAAAHTLGDRTGSRKGPRFLRLRPDMTASEPLDGPAQDARRAFVRNPDQEIVILPGEDERGRSVYRCFRAVRVESSCFECHGPSKPVRRQFRSGEFVGMIEASMPGETEAGRPLVWWTRYALFGGGALAAVFAFIVFALIAQRLILHPLRRLRHIADRVAEGDLTVRSTIRTGDELQRLGESFNEMLAAISDQHNKLRAANRALDLKLHELAEANVTLFQANQVKSEFLANVSHELRTPLNSIIGFAELIAESPDERLHRYGQNIHTAAKNLLDMINHILDLAKIEAGKADVRFDRVSVTDACHTLLALIGPLADKKQLALRSEIAEDLPIITTDPGKFQQILYNLLSNAVKFTPPGGTVTLAAATETFGRAGQADREVHVSVSDTGPGIAEADQQHVFEKFYQLDRTLTKESAGTGLGLAIAKELTSLLGGRMMLKSTPGHGATFILTLPIEPAQPAQPIEHAAESGLAPDAGTSGRAM
ncbi:MAG TPA: ATP-binding protein [Phycisphaerae bacterium]|nr:ATP-binding protein [Phycisphaerae bacterium]